MRQNKKKVWNFIFLAAVFLLTIYGVFHEQDLNSIFEAMLNVNAVYLYVGILCVLFFIWGESYIIHYMLKTLKIKTKKRFCFLYSCVGFFFSCITPSASGGQPAQILYMKKDNIPVPVATLVLMIVTITYKSILVFTGIYLVIFQHGFIQQYLTDILPVFYLGVFLNIVCCTFMLLLVFHPDLAKKIILLCCRILTRLHLVKDKPERLKLLADSMEQYHTAAIFFREHVYVIFYVIFITFLQRFSLFFVTYFVYKAFRLDGAGVLPIIGLQAVISVSVDMLPLPGGMGISEKLFSIIFVPIFGMKFLLPGMILSRGIAYYVQLLVSAAGTILAHFSIGRKSAGMV